MEGPGTFTILDPDQQDKAAQTAIEVQLANTAAGEALFKRVFNSDDGCDVLRRMALFCHENESCFVGGNQDLTVFREGERNVILWIRRWLDGEIKTTPDQGEE